MGHTHRLGHHGESCPLSPCHNVWNQCGTDREGCGCGVHQGRKKKKAVSEVFCWYCDREFDTEVILLQHQNVRLSFAQQSLTLHLGKTTHCTYSSLLCSAVPQVTPCPDIYFPDCAVAILYYMHDVCVCVRVRIELGCRAYRGRCPHCLCPLPEKGAVLAASSLLNSSHTTCPRSPLCRRVHMICSIDFDCDVLYDWCAVLPCRQLPSLLHPPPASLSS